MSHHAASTQSGPGAGSGTDVASRRRRLLPLLYVAGLLALVMSPIGWLLNRLCLRLYVLWRYDLGLPGDVRPGYFGFGLNVLLFVPLGVLAVLWLRQRWWAAALAAVVVSAAIELVQLVPALGRLASLTDLVGNSLGGLLGALAAAWWLRRRPPR